MLKFLNFNCFVFFSRFLTLFIILPKPLKTKANNSCASGDCGMLVREIVLCTQIWTFEKFGIDIHEKSSTFVLIFLYYNK